MGDSSIICLLGPAELAHYASPASELGAAGLIALYEAKGFEVRSFPWEDPKYRVGQGGRPYDDQLREASEKCLRAFDELPKPVLLHCSSGIQRSSPVAAFIRDHRDRTK